MEKIDREKSIDIHFYIHSIYGRKKRDLILNLFFFNRKTSLSKLKFYVYSRIKGVKDNILIGNLSLEMLKKPIFTLISVFRTIKRNN